MTRSKVAIIGYTPHKAQAPYGDDAWECWGLNDLYLDLAQFFPVPPWRLRWFQLHAWQNLQKVGQKAPSPFYFSEGPPHPRDANHVPYLQQLNGTKEQGGWNVPLYLMHPRPELPNARIVDREAIAAYFPRRLGRYLTNSISYMIAYAIMEMAPDHKAKKDAELGIFGVDMMVAGGAGSEYGWQRPSVEAFIGYAEGLGIPVHIPDESDLLACAFAYGDELGNQYRNRMTAAQRLHAQQFANFQANRHQIELAEAEARGASNALMAMIGNWLPGDGGHPYGATPQPDMHKVAGTNGQPNGNGLAVPLDQTVHSNPMATREDVIRNLKAQKAEAIASIEAEIKRVEAA